MEVNTPRTRRRVTPGPSDHVTDDFRPSLVWDSFVSERIVGSDCYGQPIYEGFCTHCHKHFKNHRSFYAHIKNCGDTDANRKLDEFFGERAPAAANIPTVTSPTETLTMSEADRSVVLAICKLNLPISTVGKEEWKNLMSAVGATVKTPCPRKLRCLIVALAAEFRETIHQELRGKHVSVIADGGTLGDRTVYAVAFFTGRKIYFGAILTVEVSDHKSLAEALSVPLRKAMDAGAVITAIITDNARNLVLATTDCAQGGIAPTTVSVQQILGTPILHLQCGIHTANLTITDYCHESPDFATFKKEITDLFKFLRKKAIKKKLKKAGVTTKIPMIQDIKWLTYVQAFQFLKRYDSEINSVLRETKAENDKQQFDTVKDSWRRYLLVLEPLGVFETSVQTNNIYLGEYYEMYRVMIDELLKLQMPEANTLVDLLRKRLEETGFMTIAELSFIFQRSKLDEVRRKFHLLFSWAIRDVHDPQRPTVQTCYQKMTAKLVQICTFWGVHDAADVVPIMFETFLKEMQHETRETTEAFYRNLMSQKLRIKGRWVSWEGFAIVAFRLARLPASEAIAERMFSHLSNLFPAQRWGSGDDLLQDQMTIRMQSLFNEYNRKTDLNQ